MKNEKKNVNQLTVPLVLYIQKKHIKLFCLGLKLLNETQRTKKIVYHSTTTKQLKHKIHDQSCIRTRTILNEFFAWSKS